MDAQDEQNQSGSSIDGVDQLPDDVTPEEVEPPDHQIMSDIEHVEESQRLDLLAREAHTAVTRPIVAGKALQDLWEEGSRRYLGDHWDYDPREGFKHETVNKVMGVAITHVAAETEAQPTVIFTPVESSDEPRVIYLKPKGKRKIKRLMITGQQVAIDGFDPDAPVTVEQYEVWTGADGATQAMMSPDDFWVVDDKLVSKFVQDVFNLAWKRGCGQAIWTENSVLKNVLGSSPFLCEWDPVKNCVRFSNPHIKNVWIDPLARSVRDARYVGFDQVLSKEEAVKAFPEYEDQIEHAARTGTVTNAGELRLGAVYTQTAFERKMLILRTVWERGASRPMTDVEAVESGKVQRVSYTMEDAWSAGLVTSLPSAPGVAVMSSTGAPADVSSADWPVYYALPNGEPVDPSSEAWPQTEAIRETQVLADIQRVLDQRVSDYCDIPIVMPINIPIPYSAYGLSEPCRLEDVQQLANRVLSAISNIIRSGAYPQEYMPKELVEELEAAGISPHASPNNIIPIEGASWDRYFSQRGQLGFAVQPPPVGETLIRLVDMFLKMVDELGGNVGVLQGRVPGGMSGEAINTLTTNAKGPLSLKSAFAEQALEQVALMVVDMMIRFTPPAIFAKYFTSYPPHLLDYLKTTVSSMAFDVDVQIASGKGANKQITENSAVARLKAGVISVETAQEQMGINPDVERRRRKSQAQEEMDMAQEAAARQAALQPPPGGPAVGIPNGPVAGQ